MPSENLPVPAPSSNSQSTSEQASPRQTASRQISPWQPSHAAQQRVWEADGGTDNLVSEVVFRGPLDVAELVSALDNLHAQTEALRFTLVSSNDQASKSHSQAKQGQSEPVEHQHQDLSHHEEPEQAYRRLLADSACENFVLAESCCRSQILRLSAEYHIWLLVQHPLTTDTASQRLLAQQLTDAFLAAGDGSNSGSELPFEAFGSHTEQLEFHQDYLASKQCAVDTAFFEPRNLRAIEPHRFYNGRIGTLSSVRTIRETVQLSVGHVAALTRHIEAPSDSEVGGEVDHKLAAFFQTVLLGTLLRIGGNREQALGVALRDASSPSGLYVGNASHWSALWVAIEETDTFASLGERIRADYAELLQHRRLHQPKQSTDSGILFEVCCAASRPRLAQGQGVTIRQAFSRSGHYSDRSPCEPQSAISLQAMLAVDGSGCRLDFDFDATRLSGADAARFTQHAMQLLDCALYDWEQKLATASLLSGGERQQLLALNPQPVPPGLDVIAGFEAQVARVPAKRALLYGQTSLSYLQLNARANRLARALQAQGVGADDWVAIALERGIDLVAILLACLKVGATYVPLDPSHPASRNGLVLEVAAPRALVVNRDADPELKALAHCPCLCVEELLEQCPVLDSDSEQNISAAVQKAERLAYVIFTSGSTGKPKGVQVPRATLANFLSSMQKEPGFTASDSLLSLTTISFDIAALELFLPLVSGGWLEIADRLFALDPRALIKRLDSGDLTMLQATPATWRMLIEAGWSGSKSLKALCGGEALPPALAAQLCQRTHELWNMYGPTETTIWSTLEKVSPKKKGISIGHPIDNTQIYILDDQAALLPQGVVGELVIGGLGVALGYAGLPDLTAEKFLQDPFNPVQGARMYRTGDLGRWLDDGTLECLGRVDFQVKIRGFRIELGEIETAIAKQGSLPEAIVVAREVTPGNTDLVAYGKAGSAFDAEPLRAFLNACLPGYMVPAFFVALEAWPLTHNGKIDRKALPAPSKTSGSADDTPFEAPATELEQRIAGIWCRTLNVERVGRNEDLFASGGSSLSAVRLLLNLAEMPEGEIALGTFLKNPTVRGIAEAMQSPDNEERAVVVELNQTSVKESQEAPLFCICGVHLYSEIAHAMPERPVLGVYLPLEKLLMGLGKQDNEPLPTLEEVAASYIDAIVEQQPRGPYYLSGLSFGGVVAFEMARQLKERGEIVQLLALFDSILPVAKTFKRSSWAMDHARRGREEGLGYVFNRPGVKRRLQSALALPNRAKAWLGGSRSQSQNGEGQAEVEPESPIADSPIASSQAADSQRSEDRVVEEQQWIDRREDQVRVFDLITDEYEPRMQRIAGDATFFRAVGEAERAGIRVEGDGGWHRWLGGKIDVHQLEGDHMGILQGESAKKIARVLASQIAAED